MRHFNKNFDVRREILKQLDTELPTVEEIEAQANHDELEKTRQDEYEAQYWESVEREMWDELDR